MRKVTIQENYYAADCLRSLRGKPYCDTLDHKAGNFRGFVVAQNLSHFRFDEITAPAHPDFSPTERLIPPRQLWIHAGIVLRLADAIREGVGQPVHMKHFYRPKGYNAAVNGAPKSDHIDACAADLVFQDVKQRRRGMAIINTLDHLLPQLQLSVGVGHKTIHIGALSARGRRRWQY